MQMELSMKKLGTWGLLMGLLLTLGLATACGEDGQDEEVDQTALLECQNACTLRMRCETALGIDADIHNDCLQHCSDASAPADYPAEEVHIACSKEWDLCEDYMACVKRVTAYEEGVLYDEFCTAWCDRCTWCMEQDETFSDGMCRHANEGDGHLCLSSCQEHIDRATQTCSRMFEMVDPSGMTCEDLAGNSPFDEGC
jgi:hypothetical protein